MNKSLRFILSLMLSFSHDTSSKRASAFTANTLYTSFLQYKPVPESISSSLPFSSATQMSAQISSDNKGDRIDATRNRSRILQKRKREWIQRSLTYYAVVSREEKRRENGQFVPTRIEYQSNFETAKKLYFARQKVKSNQPRLAEQIYRQLIDALLLEQEEGGQCNNAQLAISTLLLSLLLQRQGEIKETRATFIRFFRIITLNTNGDFDNLKECTCSAKVLQAFALFEMKQKNVRKAYSLITMAVQLDKELEPVLQWKQFRDARKLMKGNYKRP